MGISPLGLQVEDYRVGAAVSGEEPEEQNHGEPAAYRQRDCGFCFADSVVLAPV